MIRIKILLCSLIILFSFPVYYSHGSEPGKRPDETPWIRSTSAKIVDLFEDLYELKSERDESINELMQERDKAIAKLRKKRSDAGIWGFPGITDSKNDYDEKITATRKEYSEELTELRKYHDTKIRGLKEKITDTMASPSNDDIRDKKEALAKIQRISEMWETISAILNTQEVLRTLNSELRLNLSDYELASKTYNIQLDLLFMATQINDAFIDRLGNYYKPKLISRIERNNRAIRKNNDLMRSDKSIDKDWVDKQNGILNKISANIETALERMQEMKKNAVDRRAQIIGAYNRVKIIKRGSDAAGESSGYVANINEEFESTKFKIPELVEFEYIDTDLELSGALPGS